nr:uncharacterized protein LOC128686625 isoform X2 [Cherax quadricarinatus]
MEDKLQIQYSVKSKAPTARATLLYAEHDLMDGGDSSSENYQKRSEPHGDKLDQQVDHVQFHMATVAEGAVSTASHSRIVSPLDEEPKYHKIMSETTTHYPLVQRVPLRKIRNVTVNIITSPSLLENTTVQEVEELLPEKFFERLKSLRNKVFNLAEKIEKMRSGGDISYLINELQDDSKPLIHLYNILKGGSYGAVNTTEDMPQLGYMGYKTDLSSLSMHEENINSSVRTDGQDSFIQMINFFRHKQTERNDGPQVGKNMSNTVSSQTNETDNVFGVTVQDNGSTNLPRQVDKLREFLIKVNASQKGDEDMFLRPNSEDLNLTLDSLWELLLQQNKLYRNINISQEIDKARVASYSTLGLGSAEDTVELTTPSSPPPAVATSKSLSSLEITVLPLESVVTTKKANFSTSSTMMTTLEPVTLRQMSSSSTKEANTTSSQAQTTSEPVALTEMVISTIEKTDPSTSVTQGTSVSTTLIEMSLSSASELFFTEKTNPSTSSQPTVTAEKNERLYNISKEQTEVPETVATEFTPNGITSPDVDKATLLTTIKWTAPPRKFEKASKMSLAGTQTEIYHDHTVLLIALLVAGLASV